MQQTIGVAVVAAQLAATDRRALSQAWYSALHLADHAPRTTPARGALAASARIGGSSPLAGSAPPAGISHVPPGGRPAVRAAIPRTASAEAHERRFARTELARSIERGLARRTPRSGAVSFAIRTRGARVHLVVRVDGGRSRVVAVCPAVLRERVERALAHARFALAARGVRTEVA